LAPHESSRLFIGLGVFLACCGGVVAGVGSLIG